MRERRRRGRQVCWLCDLQMKITVPPYQRHSWSYCKCKEEGRIGGTTMPYGLSEEEIQKAREDFTASLPQSA